MNFEIPPLRQRRADAVVLRCLCLVLLVVCTASVVIADDDRDGRSTYFPGKWDDWETRSPQQVGMDATRLEKAIDFAKGHETSRPVDLHLAIRTSIAGQAFDELIGPTKPRGSINGMVLRHGYIVAEWGDTHRVDMTFSATKSYLATAAGIAFDKGRRISDNTSRGTPGLAQSTAE